LEKRQIGKIRSEPINPLGCYTAVAYCLCLIRFVHSFCSSGFQCSGPSIAIEKVIWAAKKKFADHWCKVTTTNSIQTWPVTRVAGGAKPPLENVSPHLEKCVGHCL